MFPVSGGFSISKRSCWHCRSLLPAQRSTFACRCVCITCRTRPCKCGPVTSVFYFNTLGCLANQGDHSGGISNIAVITSVRLPPDHSPIQLSRRSVWCPYAAKIPGSTLRCTTWNPLCPCFDHLAGTCHRTGRSVRHVCVGKDRVPWLTPVA
jgi:hypothetical protein